MVFTKRIYTAILLFVVLFIALWVVSSGVLGAIAGMMASSQANAHDFQSGYAVGREAGAAMGRKYGAFILFGSSGIAGITAGALSFSGLFPWCRRRQIVIPPLPTAP